MKLTAEQEIELKIRQHEEEINKLRKQMKKIKPVKVVKKIKPVKVVERIIPKIENKPKKNFNPFVKFGSGLFRFLKLDYSYRGSRIRYSMLFINYVRIGKVRDYVKFIRGRSLFNAIASVLKDHVRKIPKFFC